MVWQKRNGGWALSTTFLKHQQNTDHCYLLNIILWSGILVALPSYL